MQIRKTIIASIAATGFAALAAYGILRDGGVSLDDWRNLGLGGGIATLMWFFVSRGRCSDAEVYEAGRQAGYDAGFIDGRRIARPVVVPLEQYREALVSAEN